MKRGLVIVLLVLLGAGVYAYLNPDSVRAVRHWLADRDLAEQPTTTLYRWRGKDGQWRVTDEPPPAGVDYERLEYRRDTNVLPPPPGAENGD